MFDLGILLLLVTTFILGQGDACNQPSLFYTTENTINCINIGSDGRQTGSLQYLYFSGYFKGIYRYQIRPISLDIRRNKMYWQDFYKKAIYEANTDGTNIKQVMTGITGVVGGMALDWISKYIYWTDNIHDWIVVGSLDGNYKKVLVSEKSSKNVSGPTGIAVEPIAGYLFWVDSIIGAVERCRLDGSGRTLLANRKGTYPTDVSIDFDAKRLYWVELIPRRVCSCDYEGKAMSCTLFRSFIPRIWLYSLTYYSALKTVYLTDLAEYNLKSLQLTSETIDEAITTRYTGNFVVYSKVLLFDISVQPAGLSPCNKIPKPCSHFCFKLDSNTHKCGCPTGMLLQSDGKTCTNVKAEFSLYFADGYVANLYHLTQYAGQKGSKLEQLVTPERTSFPIALDYDPESKMLFWTDANRGKIYKMHVNGTNYQELFAGTGLSEGLAFDRIGQLLYWTNNNLNAIEVGTIDGTSRVVLVNTGLDQPRDIALYQEKGKMFVTDWGTKPKIEQMNMDGTNRLVLVTSSATQRIYWPNGLTVDRTEDVLYYVDAYFDKIVSYDLKSGRIMQVLNHFTGVIPSGSLRVEFRVSNKLEHPFGLALHKEYLYWTDWKTATVYQVNKRFGNNITLVAGGLFRPEDMHAYNEAQTNDYRKVYLFAYATQACGNTCDQSKITSLKFASCPSGYKIARTYTGCPNCTDSVPLDSSARCSCTSWATCVHRIQQKSPCTINNALLHFGVRECVETVKPGYCPVINFVRCSTTSSQCSADDDCSENQKCCKSNCGNVCSSPSVFPPVAHPCQSTFKECDVCITMPNNTHRCMCPSGKKLSTNGKTCISLTGPCADNGPCLNGATCTVFGLEAKCYCVAGFTGSKCETRLQCFSSPCQNSGTCMELSNDYKCICPYHTTGKNCDVAASCPVNTCKNNATCYLEADGNKKCTCTDGYTGAECELKKPCYENPCKNGGSCSSPLGLSYKCTCAAGYYGTNCEHKDLCASSASSSCKNGGECINQPDGNYKCSCAPGFSGSNCETRVYCHGVTCKNGGTCINLVDNYQCNCASGYTGRNCETRIFCYGVICRNGGSCFNGPNDYTCDCASDYTGRNCETKIDNCIGHKCLNGASCIDGDGTYRCSCSPDYTGRFCETKFCRAGYCQNGGFCANDQQSCICPPYYFDENCALYGKNNILHTTVRPNKNLVTRAIFQTAISQASTLYCRTYQACQTLSSKEETEGILSDQPAIVYPNFTRNDVVVIVGYPKSLSNGDQEIEFTVYVPKQITLDDARKLMSLNNIKDMFSKYKDLIERLIGASIVTLDPKAGQSGGKDETKGQRSIGIGVGIGALLVAIPIALLLLYCIVKRRKQKERPSGPPMSFSNNAFYPEGQPDLRDFSQDPRGLPMEAPPDYDEDLLKFPLPPPLYDRAEFPHLQNPIYETEKKGGLDVPVANIYESIGHKKGQQIVDLPPPVDLKADLDQGATGFENPVYRANQEDPYQSLTPRDNNGGFYEALGNKPSDEAGPLPTKVSMHEEKDQSTA